MYNISMHTVKIVLACMGLGLPAMLQASPMEACASEEQSRGAWLKDASEQEILKRISQSLGSQDIAVTDPSTLMAIAKELGLIK